MRLRDLFTLSRVKQETVPERGIYKGVQYRIDGDTIVFKCSSGKELTLSPDSRLDSDAYDRIRDAAVKKRHYIGGTFALARDCGTDQATQCTRRLIRTAFWGAK